MRPFLLKTSHSLALYMRTFMVENVGTCLHQILPSICLKHSNKQAIYLVEASMEDPLDLIIFKRGSLDLSCCILIIKRHSLCGCWTNRNRKAETNINWVKYPTSHHKLEQINILCSKCMIGLKEMLWTRPNQITGTGRKP